MCWTEACCLFPVFYAEICQSASGCSFTQKMKDIWSYVLLPQLRYQKCLVARPPSQRAGSSSAPSPDSVTRRVTTSVKRGVQSLIDTLKTKKQPSELPQQWYLPVTALSRGRLNATHTLSPQHVISTCHGNRGCTYMLKTTADGGKTRNHPVSLMIEKQTKNKKCICFMRKK